jgi:hypothetical protein
LTQAAKSTFIDLDSIHKHGEIELPKESLLQFRKDKVTGAAVDPDKGYSIG